MSSIGTLLFGIFFLLEVCLQDSTRVFYEHGMQGRSSRDNEVTQEVYDHTRSFQVIGSADQ